MNEWMDHCQMMIINMVWCFDSFCYVGTADTPCFNKTVIGGIASTFSGPDNTFIIDFSTDTFPNGSQVNISVCLGRSLHFEIPKGYKLLSRIYHISASEKLQHPVNLTLEHNAVITTEEEAKSLVILHQNDKGEIEILHGHAEPYSNFITFQLNEFCNITSAGPGGLKVIYFLFFYRQNKISNYDDNPYLKILALISRSQSTHEVFYTINILISLSLIALFRIRERNC